VSAAYECVETKGREGRDLIFGIDAVARALRASPVASLGRIPAQRLEARPRDVERSEHVRHVQDLVLADGDVVEAFDQEIGRLLEERIERLDEIRGAGASAPRRLLAITLAIEPGIPARNAYASTCAAHRLRRPLAMLRASRHDRTLAPTPAESKRERHIP
jgi:hypothetical protein